MRKVVFRFNITRTVTKRYLYNGLIVAAVDIRHTDRAGRTWYHRLTQLITQV